MKKILKYCLLAFFVFSFDVKAQSVLSYEQKRDEVIFTLSDGELHIIPYRENCVRIQYKKQIDRELPEWIYIDRPTPKFTVKEYKEKVCIRLTDVLLEIDKTTGKINYFFPCGKILLQEGCRFLNESSIQGEKTYCAEQQFLSSDDEYLYGLGQFQDGYLNLRGLSRRLTQVNTQISIPFLLSNKGYGILWNNYGLTEFNPADNYVDLLQEKRIGGIEEVDATSTEGGKKDVRETYIYSATINVPESGKYAIMLDVGQKMARKHYLEVDGEVVFDMSGIWLPPTTSALVDLEAGNHVLRAELSGTDKPKIYYKVIDDKTVFRSPVSTGIDYTIFVGSPDEIIAAYRRVTGSVPLMPSWAMGYIHCRERFRSQQEILETAKRFRTAKYPLDVIVQDWQYWGKHGWNAMRFDEDRYPDPKQLVDSLHNMDIRFMLSVWSKIDTSSEVGKRINMRKFYIPNTSWVDFFNPDAADFYWENYSKRLLKAYNIDAWWQDATEPENDDLVGRKILNGTIPGEVYRNAYPLLVNKTVYEGLRRDTPHKRPMILTRSAFPGMQRYSTAVWSGDVGYDWETLRRQIVGGLGIAASGFPWWTYDAGGFFRPEHQYTDTLYRECSLRWLQTSMFLPLMRVHGYKSKTEFWNYGEEVERVAHKILAARYRLFPYIYTHAAAVTFDHSTMMRPLVMDFPTDSIAMSLKYEYMFGPSLLIAPVVEPSIEKWKVYFPQSAGWYDLWTGSFVATSGWKYVPVTKEYAPAFVKAGTILPLAGLGVQNTYEAANSPWEIRIYAGADGECFIYEDEGVNYGYEQGNYAVVRFTWDDRKKELVIHGRKGSFPNMKKERVVRVVKIDKSEDSFQKEVLYKGKKIVLRL